MSLKQNVGKGHGASAVPALHDCPSPSTWHSYSADVFLTSELEPDVRMEPQFVWCWIEGHTSLAFSFYSRSLQLTPLRAVKFTESVVAVLPYVPCPSMSESCTVNLMGGVGAGWLMHFSPV